MTKAETDLRVLRVTMKLREIERVYMLVRQKDGKLLMFYTPPGLSAAEAWANCQYDHDEMRRIGWRAKRVVVSLA